MTQPNTLLDNTRCRGGRGCRWYSIARRGGAGQAVREGGGRPAPASATHGSRHRLSGAVMRSTLSGPHGVVRYVTPTSPNQHWIDWKVEVRKLLRRMGVFSFNKTPRNYVKFGRVFLFLASSAISFFIGQCKPIHSRFLFTGYNKERRKLTFFCFVLLFSFTSAVRLTVYCYVVCVFGKRYLVLHTLGSGIRIGVGMLVLPQ